MVSSLALLFFQEEVPQEIPAGAAAGMGVFAFVYIAIIILLIAAMWKVFTKAGKPVWWIVLFLIPFVNFIILIIVAIAVAKNFGKGTGFGLGLAFLSPIFYPILAWGDAQYNPQP
ncbi:MAG TPA: DUF5684 domain-containing protein [Thermoanaerobaculia bacterium]|nr:DUF5684 domain-containing protein [Thermoanaerobaculia bacterium]